MAQSDAPKTRPPKGADEPRTLGAVGFRTGGNEV